MEFNRVFNYNRYERMFNVGDIVKVTANQESFWVTIIEATGATEERHITGGFLAGTTQPATSNTYFKARVDNYLVDERNGDFGDIVEFDISHVIGVWE